MLVRSTSSRRRRASRSAASSPQTRMTGTRSAATSPGRRASIAVSPVDGNRGGLLPSEINRSPRHSIIPDISLMETRDDHGDVDFDVEMGPKNRSPRHSLIPDSAMSPRNSLVPDSSRSPRHSLVPNDQRSSRNSLVPDSALSPRNSLTPDQYNRSPRNSLIPDQNRTPRHSLTPESNVYGSRLSIAETGRSPRNSLLPDGTRPTRPVVVASESTTWNEEGSRISRLASPRGSIVPETMVTRTSPRGSITGDFAHEPNQRSPRGSIGPENGCDLANRSPRGSIAPVKSNMAIDMRSSRGSLTLTFQEPPLSSRRSSADNPQGPRVRSTSPSCRSSKGNINTDYGARGEKAEGSGSRRASSSVSQMSGDEQRRLCADQKYQEDQQTGLAIGLSLTTYGSVAYQLKDANLEANGTCDFVCKAMQIVNKTTEDDQRLLLIETSHYGTKWVFFVTCASILSTIYPKFKKFVVVTILLVCLSVLPIIMLIMGIQFLRDCPREPNIPIYMVVGGSVGCIKMALTLWNQLHGRRIDVGSSNGTPVGSKVASVALTLLLIIWFGLGNYWILKIKWPDYSPTLYEPNKWCHKTLYVFSLVHLCIVYSLLAMIVVLVIVLAACQLFGCHWLGPTRYK